MTQTRWENAMLDACKMAEEKGGKRLEKAWLSNEIQRYASWNQQPIHFDISSTH
jgi:hypothetical protein